MRVGFFFVKSIDPLGNKDGALVFDLVDECIEEIGEKNVVQVVTNIAQPNLTLVNLLREKRPWIYWTECAAHCIELMLEDIASLPDVSKIIATAKVITIFLCSNTHVFNLTKVYLGKDLVHSGVTHFSTVYLNLKSIQEKKKELSKLFRSDELDDWGYHKKEKGKRAAKIVRSDNFWHGLDDAVKIFEPLVEVLRCVIGNVPAMGFLYGDLLDAKWEIALSFDNNETKYKAVLEIIDNRWNDKFKTPLHLASRYLNLCCYHSNKLDIERKGIFRSG